MIGIVVPPATGSGGDSLSALVAVLAVLLIGFVLVAFVMWDHRARQQAASHEFEEPVALPNAA
jgi:hypothetical protein